MVNKLNRRGFLHRPQQVWFRKLNFQIHLWAGLILCLYSILIGISGSVLVFEEELSALTYPRLMGSHGERANVSSDSLLHAATEVRAAYQDWQLNSIYAPGVRGGNYAAVISRAGRYSYVFASALDGTLLGALPLDQGWLNWMADLHFRLLAGETGLKVNGAGALCLLLLCVTGIVIWWPGLLTWKRALTAKWTSNWRRFNFDLHRALGFWTILWMTIWAISGIYFVWPTTFVAFVNRLSQTTNASPPEIHIREISSRSAFPSAFTVAAAVQRETSRNPKQTLQGINFASGDQPLSVILTTTALSDFTQSNWIYLDPASGKELGVWRRGDNRTAGDWFVWLLEPLHFGTCWGLAAKALWCALGLALPLLAITGAIMYWNRYLRRKWRSFNPRAQRCVTSTVLDRETQSAPGH